mmetsp:Transcript_249/g.873  ORF Transcript_249/g.873 Transcript_249/m.873 type:complete len:165 (-) Transcript_249:19-513(-)
MKRANDLQPRRIVGSDSVAQGKGTPQTASTGSSSDRRMKTRAEKKDEPAASAPERSDSLSEGHTIILVQYGSAEHSKTWLVVDGVGKAMDFLCQSYEQTIKVQHESKDIECPGGEARYTLAQLWDFIDELFDIVCLVYVRGQYTPHNREWVKRQLFEHLKGQLT